MHHNCKKLPKQGKPRTRIQCAADLPSENSSPVSRFIKADSVNEKVFPKTHFGKAGIFALLYYK
jgi:hypothetical protein